jgi:hypothetical protein
MVGDRRPAGQRIQSHHPKRSGRCHSIGRPGGDSVSAEQSAGFTIFFRLGPDGWMLDFAAMHRGLGFNHKNQWFFRSPEHDFMFAFNDMVLDRNGFPHKRP